MERGKGEDKRVLDEGEVTKRPLLSIRNGMGAEKFEKASIHKKVGCRRDVLTRTGVRLAHF